MLTRTAAFGDFRLDPVAGQLFRGEQGVALRSRTWDVLCYLVSRSGELVTKSEILEAVWRDAVVSEQTLSTSIAELRRALGDDPQSPRFIETVRRRGFRFVASVRLDAAPEAPVPPLGRARETQALLRWWSEARAGRRRIGFVTGEVGMGKTTLVRAFLDRVELRGARVATGPCIEGHGEGEPFLPVIDAVRRLGRSAGDVRVGETIRAHAPPWLVELLGASAEAGPEPAPAGPTTRVETLRCLAETLEALASDVPLVLVLEDVHWSDASTVDLLDWMGRRPDPARLLILATLRPAEALASGHPVTQVMRALPRRPGCEAIELEGLAPGEAAELFTRRLGGGALPLHVATRLVEHTGGNPFFLGEMAEHLASSGGLAESDGAWELRDPAKVDGLPEGVLAAIEPRIARLDEAEQRALEAAALIGAPLSPAIVSEALAGDPDEEAVDACFSRLAARGELVAHGEGEGYRFLHALDRAALLQRVPEVRRRRLHGRIARALERGGAATPAVLADHFARAGSGERALSRYEEAVSVAKERFADREVALLCTAALAHLETLPPGRSRAERELRLRLELGAATLSTRGYSAPEQAATFGRVSALADELGQPTLRFLGAGGLFFHHMSSGDVSAGRALAERMLALAPGLPDALEAAAHTGMGVALLNAGDLNGALAHLERERAEPLGPGILQVDVPVFRLNALALTHAHLGRLERARASIGEAVARGASGGRPFDLANGHRGAAELYAVLGEVERVLAHAREAIAISEEHGFAQLLAIARLFEGWGLAHAGEPDSGLEAIREALAALEPTGYRLTHSGFRLRQAEAALLAGEPEAAERAAEAGLAYVERSGERRHVSDLVRLRGRGRLHRAGGGAERAAEDCFEAAGRLAREQGAVLPELRALLERAALPGRAGAVSSLRRRLGEVPNSLPARELEAARRIGA